MTPFDEQEPFEIEEPELAALVKTIRRVRMYLGRNNIRAKLHMNVEMEPETHDMSCNTIYEKYVVYIVPQIKNQLEFDKHYENLKAIICDTFGEAITEAAENTAQSNIKNCHQALKPSPKTQSPFLPFNRFLDYIEQPRRIAGDNKKHKPKD